MVGNFIDMRFAMGNVLGLNEEFEFKDFFFQGKTLDENLQYPSLKQLKEAFHKISPLVYNRAVLIPAAMPPLLFNIGWTKCSSTA